MKKSIVFNPWLKIPKQTIWLLE